MATVVTALVWTPDFQIGVPELDHQHQFLCELVNRFAVAADRRESTTRLLRVLQNIMEFQRLHDAAEEALMREVGYASLSEHAGEHQQMLDYLKRQYERLLRNEHGAARKLRDDLVRYCRRHIGGSDQGVSLLFHMRRRDGAGPAPSNRKYAKTRPAAVVERADLGAGTQSESHSRFD